LTNICNHEDTTTWSRAGFTGRQQSPDIAKRLPPGQSLTADFLVLSAGLTPHISLDDWFFTLKVGSKPVAK